ncbi:MAG: PD-(D/E)XK nuclease family protein [Bacteroidota bacterium]
MTIYFGLELDDLCYPDPAAQASGTFCVGEQGLLALLETHLGLVGHPKNNAYLRIEQYRQAIMRHLATHPDAFYQASFVADQFAVATELLSRRDELLLANWNFVASADCPARLQTIAAIEQLIVSYEQQLPQPQPDLIVLAAGFADRFDWVLRQLQERKHPIRKLYLNEPIDLLPSWYQRLLALLEDREVQIIPLTNRIEDQKSDLAILQRSMRQQLERGKKYTLQGDGSLCILKAKRETDAASYLATLLRRNPDYRPVCLIPDKNRALDNALIQEGQPSMGILSASLARPSLQILKLVTVFLWRPIDPFKIMEFVSLAVKPLEDELANRIATEMAQTPGMDGDGWRIMVARYFDELEKRAQRDKSLDVKEIRQQFNFWFNRTRHDISAIVPKFEVIEIFNYLQNWAYRIYDDSGQKNTSLLVLSEQSKRIKELLETLPETQLTHLELERVVRTIYEPSPVQFKEKEVGYLPHVHYSSALIGKVEDLLWWNFSQSEPNHFFSRWYTNERDYLTALGCRLRTPTDENKLLLWQRKRPFLQTKGRVVLIVPERVEGSDVLSHPLSGDLDALFDNLSAITFDIDTDGGAGQRQFEALFDLPKREDIPQRQLGYPKPFLEVPAIADLAISAQETFSSLDALFYYPYKWMFRYKLRLIKSSILSVVNDRALMGNLAHKLFEKMFAENIQQWDKSRVEQWVEEQTPPLLAREGAVLLMYGREPEKVNFINRMKYSAWSLISTLQRDGWSVSGNEEPLKGTFKGIPMKGIADLVLTRGEERAVIDLKYGGMAYRENMIRNEEDLQLVLYSKLLDDKAMTTHTAYYILGKGEMVARNNAAFQNIRTVNPDANTEEVNQRIYERMEKTFDWRMNQIQHGQLEIRCKATISELEETYGAELMHVLNMKHEDASFDDYRTLINLVD